MRDPKDPEELKRETDRLRLKRDVKTTLDRVSNLRKQVAEIEQYYRQQGIEVPRR